MTASELSDKEAKDVDICLYSFLSLQFFLSLPLIKLCQFFDLPMLVAYLVALTSPGLFFTAIIRILKCTGHLTLIKHSRDRCQPDHPHSHALTLKVSVYSLGLGLIASVGLNYVLYHSKVRGELVPFGFYLLLLSCFHFGEYFVTSLTNPSTLSLDSFLLDNSIAYQMAILCSFVEYALEIYLLDSLKKFNLISMFGLFFAISGEIIRKLAMLTAGKNFTHLISCTKDPEHRLVTHGVYSLMRHPSYTGWFYWAIGTQILLLNPISFVLFFYASYVFFKERIEYEEQMLIKFFKEDYIEYKRRVGNWLPIIL